MLNNRLSIDSNNLKSPKKISFTPNSTKNKFLYVDNSPNITKILKSPIKNNSPKTERKFNYNIPNNQEKYDRLKKIYTPKISKSEKKENNKRRTEPINNNFFYKTKQLLELGKISVPETEKKEIKYNIENKKQNIDVYELRDMILKSMKTSVKSYRTYKLDSVIKYVEIDKGDVMYKLNPTNIIYKNESSILWISKLHDIIKEKKKVNNYYDSENNKIESYTINNKITLLDLSDLFTINYIMENAKQGDTCLFLSYLKKYIGNDSNNNIQEIFLNNINHPYNRYSYVEMINSSILKIIEEFKIEGVYFNINSTSYYGLSNETFNSKLIRIHNFFDNENKLCEDIVKKIIDVNNLLLKNPYNKKVISYDFDGVIHKEYQVLKLVLDGKIDPDEEYKYWTENKIITQDLKDKYNKGYQIIIVTSRFTHDFIQMRNFLMLIDIFYMINRVHMTNSGYKSDHISLENAIEHYDDNLEILEDIRINCNNIKLYHVKHNFLDPNDIRIIEYN